MTNALGLMFNRRLAMAGLLLATVVAVHAEDATQAPPPRLPTLLDGPFPTWQVIEGVPEYHPQALRFSTRPKATGPRVQLFDGKSLAEFTPWLAYSNGTMFPSDESDRPLGETGMGDQFKVVERDGKPALYIVGKIWGAIITRRDLRDYHLHMRFKYGRMWSKDNPCNTGILFHSYGPNGAFGGAWMSSIEFELQTRNVGMVIPIGRDITTQIELGKGEGPGLFGGDDFHYMPGGKTSTVRLPTPVRQAQDAERPLGQWNEVDLYAVGDNAAFVVNGRVQMALSHIARVDAAGANRPLGHGKVQIESEGAEVYVSELWYEPIRSVPDVVAGL
ncbi:MAG: hypothetical protein RLZZ444_1110 [Pseudomonadota bacterium]|jgi:hypothetical protein